MWNWISKLDELRSKGVSFALLTVVRSVGSTPRDAGAKMLVLRDGTFFGTIGGGRLEQLAILDAQTFLERASPIVEILRYPLGAKTGQCCGGIIEILVETIQCGPQLYLFGAGHVGQAICKTLVGTPFAVHVIDERQEWIHSPEIPSGIIRHPVEWSEFLETATWDSQRTFTAIMTHRHDLDQEILAAAIQKPAKYIGLIGSQSKWERFQQRLSARGVHPSLLDRVICPIGLPLGGKAPQEIALSFSAQLLQIYYESIQCEPHETESRNQDRSHPRSWSVLKDGST